MKAPESRLATLADYNRGKRFMVTPDRLCLQGLYTFAFKARPGLDWQASLFMVKVNNVQLAESREQSYAVTVAFEDLEQSNNFGQGTKYPISGEGLVLYPPDTGLVEEAYLRHRFDGIDDELENIESIETAPTRVATVPFVIPVSV